MFNNIESLQRWLVLPFSFLQDLNWTGTSTGTVVACLLFNDTVSGQRWLASISHIRWHSEWHRPGATVNYYYDLYTCSRVSSLRLIHISKAIPEVKSCINLQPHTRLDFHFCITLLNKYNNYRQNFSRISANKLCYSNPLKRLHLLQGQSEGLFN